MPDDFRYDVAFSFLSSNEPLALRLKDGLADRLHAFVYSREQPDVIGRNTDGVEAFTNVFKHESRVCVVLHSNGWGSTNYTRLEESAIKERALVYGWDFLLVACLDKTPAPKWLPITKLWYGLERYGVDGLLAAIDNRVTELGGRPNEDSIVERAARVMRERQFAETRHLFKATREGLDAASREVERLPAILDARIRSLNVAFPDLALTFVQNRAPFLSIAAVSRLGSFVMSWQREYYATTLASVVLDVGEWAGWFSYGGWGGPPKISELVAEPNIDYAGKVVWRFAKLAHEFTSESLVDFLFERLLGRLEKPKDVSL
jgi:hypothetical protein